MKYDINSMLKNIRKIWIWIWACWIGFECLYTKRNSFCSISYVSMFRMVLLQGSWFSFKVHGAWFSFKPLCVPGWSWSDRPAAHRCRGRAPSRPRGGWCRGAPESDRPLTAGLRLSGRRGSRPWQENIFSWSLKRGFIVTCFFPIMRVSLILGVGDSLHKQ